jgi:hypothetical protein
MSFGACKQGMPSHTRWSEITYALASCVNLREELLAFQATLPVLKTALVSSLTSVACFLLAYSSAVFSKTTNTSSGP